MTSLSSLMLPLRASFVIVPSLQCYRVNCNTKTPVTWGLSCVWILTLITGQLMHQNRKITSPAVLRFHSFSPPCYLLLWICIYVQFINIIQLSTSRSLCLSVCLYLSLSLSLSLSLFLSLTGCSNLSSLSLFYGLSYSFAFTSLFSLLIVLNSSAAC